MASSKGARSSCCAGEDEALALVSETLRWIRQELPPGYTWPGNVRELEQCVRNVMIRGRYEPQPDVTGGPGERLRDVLAECGLSLAELEARYVETVYGETGSYQAAARRLGIDRRTVKAKLLAPTRKRLRGAGSSRGGAGPEVRPP